MRLDFQFPFIFNFQIKHIPSLKISTPKIYFDQKSKTFFSISNTLISYLLINIKSNLDIFGKNDIYGWQNNVIKVII